MLTNCDDIQYKEMLKILIVVKMFFYCELFMCLYISTAFNLNLKSQFLMLSFPFKLLKEYNVKNETVPTMFRSNQTGHSKIGTAIQSYNQD